MSTTHTGNGETGAGIADTVLGPPWPGTAQHKSDSTVGALTLFGGSEYLYAGQMIGERGNTLTVYMDRWGGTAANYIVAPEMVFSWPDSWGDSATGITEQSVNEPGGGGGVPCSTDCGLVPNTPGSSLPGCLINCGSGRHIDMESVPEPATAWLVGLCVVALLVAKRLRTVSGWIKRQTSAQ